MLPQGWKPSGTPGEVYQREMVPAIFARWAPDLVEAGQVRAGQRALDVACGTGVVTRLVAERVGPGGRAVGLDINPEMLAAARAASAGSRIEWHEGSALGLPWPEGAFDVVLCQQGLQFFPDRAAALGEMRRVLVPGGRLALSCWRSSEHQAFRALEEALARRIGPEKAKLPPFALGDRETLRGLITGAGFRDVRIRAETRTIRFASAAHMVGAAVGGAPSMLAVLAEQGEAALEAIAEEVTRDLERYVDDEGVGLPGWSHVATASR